MPRIAPNVPADTDLLCEFCGYTLNGLPADANCPECGRPAELSISPHHRHPPAWETDRQFWATTRAVIFRPTKFYRSFTTRGDESAANTFADRHVMLASILFAIGTTIHAQMFDTFGAIVRPGWLTLAGTFLGMLALIYFSITLVTQLATKLTNWEATYRGLRLTMPVVRRGLAYHAAHYLPVALISLATIGGYQIALRIDHDFWGQRGIVYLYVVSAEVIVAAGYLFQTYWIGMRNMMYANR